MRTRAASRATPMRSISLIAERLRRRFTLRARACAAPHAPAAWAPLRAGPPVGSWSSGPVARAHELAPATHAHPRVRAHARVDVVARTRSASDPSAERSTGPGRSPGRPGRTRRRAHPGTRGSHESLRWSPSRKRESSGTSMSKGTSEGASPACSTARSSTDCPFTSILPLLSRQTTWSHAHDAPDVVSITEVPTCRRGTTTSPSPARHRNGTPTYLRGTRSPTLNVVSTIELLGIWKRLHHEDAEGEQERHAQWSSESVMRRRAARRSRTAKKRARPVLPQPCEGRDSWGWEERGRAPRAT